MTEPFIGEIQVFGFNFVPTGWAQCNGALLPINSNTALFALIGVTYGGNGTTTFALPDFTDRAGCNRGQGPGLTPRVMGEAFGEAAVGLNNAQMPNHQHALTAYAQNDQTNRTAGPGAGSALTNPSSSSPFVTSTPNAAFSPSLIGTSGGGQPHENRQPYLQTNFCIALQGIFPSFD
jgi:microcystin-dependent protein